MLRANATATTAATGRRRGGMTTTSAIAIAIAAVECPLGNAAADT